MKNSILLIFIFLIPFLFISCTQKKEQIVFEKPKKQIPRSSPVEKVNKGSLYSMQGASLFADKKDLQIGDIIQVIINEDLNSDSNNTRELSESRTNKLGGGIFSGTNGNALGEKATSISNRLNSSLGVDFNTSSSSSDSGESKSSFSESFSTTVSAIIEETYQNGNYYIKGSKELLIEGQKQEIIISGVIRPYDITSDNSINSSQVANLKVLYDKDGEEADVLDTPWGVKILRAIWPF
jgi:flagellar L-ring protein precursor FlgH